MDTVRSLISLLEQYPPWVKILFYVWCMTSASLIGSLVFAHPTEKKSDESKTAPAAALLQNSQMLSAGRDFVVNAPVINVSAHSGRPTEAELMADVTLERNIPVQFEGPQPFPYYAAVRVIANRHDHPAFYVKLIADEQIEPRFLFQVQKFQGGVRSMIASAIMGNVLEHTEAAPGLQPGQPWVIAVFAKKPIKIVDAVVEDGSRFEDVAYHSWLHGIETALLSGKGNGAAVAPNDRQLALRAVSEGKLAWIPGSTDSVTLPQLIQR